MSMLDAQRRIAKQALFSVKRLGEQIEYTNENGTHTIIAIIEIGTEQSRSDWNDSHTRIENSSMNDFANISVLRSDVPNPKEGDHITYNGEVWNVSQILLYDSAGDNYTLICSRRNKVYGL